MSTADGVQVVAPRVLIVPQESLEISGAHVGSLKVSGAALYISDGTNWTLV